MVAQDRRWGSNVRFGSKADICCVIGLSAFLPIAGTKWQFATQPSVASQKCPVFLQKRTLGYRGGMSPKATSGHSTLVADESCVLLYFNKYLLITAIAL